MSNIEKIKSYEMKTKTYSKDFKTKFDTLKILADSEFKIVVKNKTVYFYYPSTLEFSDKTVQKKFKEAYTEALTIEAKNYLPARIRFLAEKFGFKYNKLALKNQRTRFGSCSFRNNINLNVNLMKYDFDVIDYVIIHELVHTKVKNHSKDFWAEVEKYCSDYKNLRKILKAID